MFFKKWQIPMGVGLVIDDIGWWHSKNLKPQGPPCLCVSDDPTPLNYINVINMGKLCGTRPQGSFVIGDFDRENVCAKKEFNKPLSPINVTEKGINWTNEITEKQASVMDYLKENGDSLEFGIHGVRHGHFNPLFENSEWARRPKKDKKHRLLPGEENKVIPWDKENKSNEIIINCFAEIMRQYFTEEELAFPESFAPPHYGFYYEENKENTTCKILGKYGVKYCNAQISGKGGVEIGKTKAFFDGGVHILDRRDPKRLAYDRIGDLPTSFPRNFPWVEVHFPNLWGREKEWAFYLYNINSKRNKVLARNTEHVHSQYIYSKYAKIHSFSGKIVLDTRNIPNEAYENNILSAISLKIPLGKREHISEIKCKDLCLCAYYKDIFCFGNLVLGSGEFMGRIPRGVYEIEYKISRDMPKFYVDSSMETYNVYFLDKRKMSLKVYGTQNIKLKTDKKFKISSNNLNILEVLYKENEINIKIKAKSMNGDLGEINFTEE